MKRLIAGITAGSCWLIKHADVGVSVVGLITSEGMIRIVHIEF